MPAPTFEETVRELVAQKGQGTVADLVGMDPTKFSRAMSGQCGFVIKEIKALMELGEYELAPKGYETYYMHLMWALIEFINFLKKRLDTGGGSWE